MIYYIYEVPGFKNGATMDWKNRRRYNFNRYQIEPIIIETLEGPDSEDMWQVVGDREWELADLNGYSKGLHYKDIRLKSKLLTIESYIKGAQSKIGNTHTIITKQKISLANKGRKRTFESKEKMSKSQIGMARTSLRKLTFEKAEEIRFKYTSKLSRIIDLAREYNVSCPAIRNIIDKKTYIS